MLSQAYKSAPLYAARWRLPSQARQAPSHVCLFTSEAATESSKWMVVSRRAWNSLKDTLPPKPPPAAKPKADDKPWPRSVRIAGYVGGGVVVPYMILWTITSNPTLREALGPYLPMDKLRSHFGNLEWNVQSYVDEVQIDERKVRTKLKLKPEVPTVEYYQFPGELPFRERQQQEIVKAMDHSKIQVDIHVSESSGYETEVTKTVSGSLLANAQTLLNLVKGVTTDATKTSATIAVDFEDDVHEKSGSDALTSALTNDATIPTPNFDEATEPSELLRETQTFSSWIYVPQQQTQESSLTTPDTEMDISRLEYTISELQRSLRDPSCTRDMDEMASELRQAKRELFGLKWKRRLRLS